MIKFSRCDISTTILKTGQAVLMRGSLPSSMYNCSLPSPHTSASASKVTCMRHAEKSSTAKSPSSGSQKLRGSITEQQGDNSSPAQLHHGKDACVYKTLFS